MKIEEMTKDLKYFKRDKEIYYRLKKGAGQEKQGPWTRATVPSWNFRELEYKVVFKPHMRHVEVFNGIKFPPSKCFSQDELCGNADCLDVSCSECGFDISNENVFLEWIAYKAENEGEEDVSD